MEYQPARIALRIAGKIARIITTTAFGLYSASRTATGSGNSFCRCRQTLMSLQLVGWREIPISRRSRSPFSENLQENIFPSDFRNARFIA